MRIRLYGNAERFFQWHKTESQSAAIVLSSGIGRPKQSLCTQTCVRYAVNRTCLYEDLDYLTIGILNRIK